MDAFFSSLVSVAFHGLAYGMILYAISVDPATRDIVQNEYLREVRRVGGRLANVELETVGTAVKDPWKELNVKK